MTTPRSRPRAAFGLSLALSASYGCASLAGVEPLTYFEDTGDGVPVERDAATSTDATSSVDGAADPDADADAAVETPFCERSTGFAACEDFERGPASLRGWTSTVAPPIAPSDRLNGGAAARLAITAEAGTGAPLLVATPSVSGATVFHLETVAKIEPGAVGTLTIAKLAVYDVNGRKLEVSIILHPGAETGVNLCYPADGGGQSCFSRMVSESFASWTSVVIEIEPKGHYVAKLAGVDYGSDTTALPSAVASIRAEVGASYVWPGGGDRVLWFDDALVSMK